MTTTGEPTDEPGTPPESVHLLGRLGALLLMPSESGVDELGQLEGSLTRVLVAARLTMVVFPVLGLAGYWSHFTRPWLVGIAVGLTVVQVAIEILLVRRGERLDGNLLVPLDLVLSVAIAFLALLGAGATGRFHGLDGFAPYLMLIAGLAGAAYQLSWRGLGVTAIAGATWAVLPLGRGARLFNDEAGFLLWFLVCSVVAGALRVLAKRLDAAAASRSATERALEAKEREIENLRRDQWLHDGVLDLLARVENAEIAPTDPLRAHLLATEARGEFLGEARPRSAAVLTKVLHDIVEKESGFGLFVDLETSIEDLPEHDEVIEVAALLLEALVANVRVHGHTDRAQLVVRANRTSFVATLSDNGCGFDVDTTRLGRHTERLKSHGKEIGLDAVVESGPTGTTWRLTWQAS